MPLWEKQEHFTAAGLFTLTTLWLSDYSTWTTCIEKQAEVFPLDDAEAHCGIPPNLDPLSDTDA